ncbi:MAG: hypothetical protein CBD16_06780 [Betaproteobacteria bacterium TMED156]|nr:MAG: hypothetical protein CBD16_06780 [Betaproteobacteria bacterium TMED156]|tara:strand:- start:1302 stop:2249 length:948 start_codon:yes stop_codon:yes gene_type:complete
MDESLSIAVLMGGESREREISLESGKAVLKSLIKRNLDAFPFDPSEKSIFELKSKKVDIAFIALHGKNGEDGNTQAILEFLKIPYTGSGVAASALAMDKVLTKRVWNSLEIETPPFRTILAKENFSSLDLSFDFPVIVKPNDEGSSLGVAKVEKKNNLENTILETFKFTNKVLVEKFITGREFTCAIIESSNGPEVRVLPIVEIIAPNGEYNFHNKYIGNETKYTCPAEIPKDIENKMIDDSFSAYKALGCQGWARVDLLWDGINNPQLIELNTVPGMTNHSLVPMAARAVGISFEELVVMILKTASLNKRGAEF